uniref:uncharacterized protein n=1 Tax=Centroberyx gerrardi TaxID=166262 RepID=UPI003AABAB8F
MSHKKIDREVLLEALSVVCNANVTSVQKQKLEAGFLKDGLSGGAAETFPLLTVNQLIPTLLDADQTSKASRSNYDCIKSVLQSDGLASDFSTLNLQDTIEIDGPVQKRHIIDEDDYFDPKYDYDFTRLKDTKTYYRGGEVYERPCGWTRFAIKVLGKYSDGNTWLGNSNRSTQSVSGEWPVSYHGTSQDGAEGIVEGHYKAGAGQKYGYGIYSTPLISEAIYYAKTFTSKKNGKRYKVILQNRINPQYREKHNKDKYWLVPIQKGKSLEEMQKIVEKAVRPYGLLLKEF